MGNETLSKYFRTHDNESRQTEFVNEIDEDEFNRKKKNLNY